ncbi:MAG: TonB-dependent receptor [Lewinellaceae bacterium]|nr:TonB-dependent receptor [Lewinellaceae bacterium]
MKNAIILFIAWVLPALALAQFSINGKVVDSETLKPLSYAIINAEGLNRAAYADEQGRFELAVPQQPAYWLSVQHLGFETFSAQVSAEEARNLDITLNAVPIVIEEILVQGNDMERTAQSDIMPDFATRISQPKDVGDLFRDIPGFGVIKRGGYAMDPVFRSFRNEQLNVQYDGGVQVMHACPNRMDPITTHVIPEEVEKIELIRGPFSVRYGQTMGGVINIITKRPEAADAFTIGGSVESGYESNGNSKLARLALNAAGKGYDVMVNGGIRDFGNYQNGAGVEIPTSFKSYDYSAKIGINTFKDHRFQLGWRQSFGRDILHVGLPMDTEEDNSSVLSADYVARNISPRLYSITIKAFAAQVDHLMSNRWRPNFMMTEATSTVDALTLGGKLELSWLPTPKSQLYTGLDLRNLSRDGERLRLVKRNMMTGAVIDPPMQLIDLIWQDAQVNDVGLFVESRRFISERLSLTGGARIDLVRATIKNPAQDFAELYPTLHTDAEWSLSAHLSADYRMKQGWDLQLALGRGVRTATMEERYINHFTLGADAYEYVGNPMLKPEANHQAELSIGRETDAYQWRMTTFYSYITNYITAAVDTTLSRKYMPQEEPKFSRRFQNINAATQMGFELEGSVQLFRHLTAYGSAAFTRAQNLDWEEPLAEIPPFAATAGLKYERKFYSLDLKGRFVARQGRIASSFGESETPGFNVFDLKVFVRPLPGLSVGAAVLNLLDRNYYEHLNRGYRNMPVDGLIYEPGRNVTLFVQYSF